MNITDILSAITATPKNQFVRVRTQRQLKTTDGSVVYKCSEHTCSNRAVYANAKVVKEAIEDGKRDAPKMPSWAERIVEKGVSLWKNKKNGQLYVPIRPVQSHKVFYMDGNGNKLSLDEVAPLLTGADSIYVYVKDGKCLRSNSKVLKAMSDDEKEQCKMLRSEWKKLQGEKAKEEKGQVAWLTVKPETISYISKPFVA